MFRDHYNIPLVHVDASRCLHRRARGRGRSGDQAQDHRPAVHRGVRGRGEEARRRLQFLAQGTLYPDVIESVSFTGGPSVTIKSHHNVGGLPERMNMKLVEPLRELFKDEVRALGRELGLPEKLRRPPSLPGPGPRDPLSGRHHPRQARHICARPTRSISTRSARPASTTSIWQAFAVLLPVQTVGVMGDGRTYEHSSARCAR
jgi:GMP synthase (glutamine-hydrolysing)